MHFSEHYFLVAAVSDPFIDGQTKTNQLKSYQIKIKQEEIKTQNEYKLAKTNLYQIRSSLYFGQSL